MPKKRRPQPDFYQERHRTANCLCGCLKTISGRKLYASPACRKAAQRRRDKINKNMKKLARSKVPDFF